MELELLTEDKYRAALRRASELMHDRTQVAGGELDKLADLIVAYEALDDAADALIKHFRVYSACRLNPKLRAEYVKRAEVAIRAWLTAIAAQTKRSAPALASPDSGVASK